MQRFNTERMTTLVGEARKAVGQLSSYRRLPAADILSSAESLGNIKYQFIVAIEACIDMCNHINAKIFSQAPESYAHCFELLRIHAVISREIGDAMTELAKFRNLLVHLYWKVDDRRVIEVLQQDLHFITDFVSEIVALTESQNP